ncbi:sporangiospore maturation cell wall hydrolase GsmA [Actinoplanes sp. NPDC049118]|uniref:sporangiospore maturation cell wall hydrolase GsmA n=1 Tax=Actinoplanes sp. NPDC049118 TaxID=3155769 RepID=UPI00340470BC
MLLTTRRVFSALLLPAGLVAGLVVAPAAASAAGVSATVQVADTLKVRSAPSQTAKIVGSVRRNQKVTVSCVITGQLVRGTVRTTTAWDQIGAGRYISHAYVKTSGKIPRCASKPPAPAPAAPAAAAPAAARYVVGTVKSADGKVNLRAGASTKTAVAGTLASGTKVDLACSVTGDLVKGTVRSTNRWDRTRAGSYISNAYIYSGKLPVCAAKTTPAPAPKLTPEQFIKAAVPGAQAGWREYGVPASVTIAQAILESGWGRSSLSAESKNYFGIKCQNGKYGKLANGCRTVRTQECTKAGKCFETSAAFRTYASQAHSFRDHGSFLKVNSRYAGAFAYTKDANKFIWKVWKAGYATDPNYYTKITGVMKTHDLYKYDTWK